MPALPRFLALGAICAAIGLAGCGGDDETEGELRQETAQELLGLLQEVQDNVDVGSCVVAQDRAGQLADAVDALPQDVDAELREALSESVAVLQSLVENPDECRPPEETVPEETTTEPEVTETTETTVPETTETTEPPPPTEPTEPTETQPSGGGGGSGGGSGGGGTGGL